MIILLEVENKVLVKDKVLEIVTRWQKNKAQVCMFLNLLCSRNSLFNKKSRLSQKIFVVFIKFSRVFDLFGDLSAIRVIFFSRFFENSSHA